MNHGLHLQGDSQILVGEGRNGGDEGVVADHLGNGSGIENRRETRVDDGITRTQVNGCVFSLGSPDGDMLQRTQLRFVAGKRRAQRSQGHTEQRFPAPECGQGLFENGIIAAGELGQ